MDLGHSSDHVCYALLCLEVKLCILLPGCCSGSWRTEDFKEYNFNAMGQPIVGGHLHPLMKVGGAGGGVRPRLVWLHDLGSSYTWPAALCHVSVVYFCRQPQYLNMIDTSYRAATSPTLHPPSPHPAPSPLV
jgi:hypothetical protein